MKPRSLVDAALLDQERRILRARPLELVDVRHRKRVAPGVLLRSPGAPRARQPRRPPDPQGPYPEEVADAELELAAHRKRIAIIARGR